jgi:cytochrome oxidase Cu insertion factor (SCO1/SenC/PrrC family)
MSRWSLIGLLGVLAYGLFGAAAGAASLESFAALSDSSRRPAPAFTLPDQHGVPRHLAEFQGKIVVVRFWVTW